jgi:phosphonate transport system ATP-binding protein
MPAIALEGVSKAYGAFHALHPMSLTAGQGETIALLGPSGSGKTTLLSLIAGEVQASSGSVLLGERDIRSLKPGRELSEQVGMIHQQFDLVPHLSALLNVLAGRLGQWSLARTIVSLVWPLERDSALAALERVGVRERASLRAAKLSGGEQQRVAIARLLLQDPAVILADEPVSSLDPARAEEVLDLLVSAARERDKTLVASVHSVELARRYFDRLIGLRNGEVQFDVPAGVVTDAMLADLYELGGLRAEV